MRLFRRTGFEIVDYWEIQAPADASGEEYWVPADGGMVRLAVYDVSGRRVRTLVNDRQSREWHQTEWDGTDDNRRRAATGSYFLRLDVEGHAPAVKRVLLVR